MSSGPIICHISGASGSGKTTLGEGLSQRYGNSIAVIDTDDFYMSGEANTAEMLVITDEDEYNRRWLCIRKRKISDAIETNSTKRAIVFVGLLDHCGPKNRHIKYEIDEAKLRYYIDISDAKLLQQYYTRLCAYGAEDPTLYDDIAACKLVVVSSSDKIKENADMKREHVAVGYEVLSAACIFGKISGLLDNN